MRRPRARFSKRETKRVAPRRSRSDGVALDLGRIGHADLLPAQPLRLLRYPGEVFPGALLPPSDRDHLRVCLAQWNLRKRAICISLVCSVTVWRVHESSSAGSSLGLYGAHLRCARQKPVLDGVPHRLHKRVELGNAFAVRREGDVAPRPLVVGVSIELPIIHAPPIVCHKKHKQFRSLTRHACGSRHVTHVCTTARRSYVRQRTEGAGKQV